MESYRELAPVIAGLNSIATVLLLAGFYFIRNQRVAAHRACMIAAAVTSSLFLALYLLYHYHVGDVRFGGAGWVRPFYFLILIPHITLAAVILPLVAATLYFALRSRFRSHRRIARWTWPLWIYVSVTGVIVYVMLYQLYPPIYPP
ncbi:MAG TPA: DUF420 domain-containing protein [Candidatus Binataceae bacterium]|nr:DUF420 domain-containing protein [Candidatus Binataceae bacterium]